MLPTDMSVRIGDAADAQHYVDRLADLYENHFIDPPLIKQAFYSKKRFIDRLVEDYIAHPGSDDPNATDPTFSLVTAWEHAELVGFLTCAALPSRTTWWSGATQPLPDQVTQEDGTRTVAIFDVVVHRQFRGQRVGSALHTHALQGRPEQRVTLLCSPQRQPAYTIWQHWGYHKVGACTPGRDGHALDILIRPLGTL